MDKLSGPDWFQERTPDGIGLNEMKGWLTGCSPTNLRMAMLFFPIYWTTRQWTAAEGILAVKLYNMWGQDWNNQRPKSLNAGIPVDVLSGGLEKIKKAPTYGN